jgi:HSP20 family protein
VLGGDGGMGVVKWDPFQDLLSIRDRMNRLFEETLSRSRTETGITGSTWAPAVDIYETSDLIVLKADLAGLTREEIEIRVQGTMLTLRGERRFAKDLPEENYLQLERVYGPFERSFSLPTTVEADNIRASFRDGVLELSIPKAEGTKPRRIAIEEA